MSTSVHIVLQGKGGVGKSVVARLLAEYMIHHDIPYCGYDADPINRTFSRLTSFGIERVDLVENGAFDPSGFDELLRTIVGAHDTSAVIDCGAATFLPFLSYVEDAEVIDLLTDNGLEVFVHTIVTGGPGFEHTFSGFQQIAERFGDKANVVVWENGFLGKVEHNGESLSDLKEFISLRNRRRICGLVRMPPMHELPKRDFAKFLLKDIPFGDARDISQANGFHFMSKHRLKKIQRQFMDAMRPVIGEQQNGQL